MIALIIVFLIISLVMLSVMFIAERDKPRNIILWALSFLLLPLVGYAAYGIFKFILYKKHKSLITKQWEDEVYTNLISNSLFNNEVENISEFYAFNKRAFNSNLTINNKCKVMSSYVEFKSDLISQLNAAKSSIIFEVVSINNTDFETIKQVLISKSKAGVYVRFVYDSSIGRALKKELKMAGVKVNRFSRYNTFGGIYENRRNLISIDNKYVYMGNFAYKNKQLSQDVDIIETFVKFEGSVVQDIDLAMYKDVVFASGKFLQFSNHQQVEYANPGPKIQFVSNSENEDLELLIVQSIIEAKKSITLQLTEFIPTESIVSLLRFAINSNIDVKLMVPLKTTKLSTYYATRAYAKELALFGANVYLYDGYIRTNSIVVDERFVLVGSYNINREHLNSALQSIAVIEDKTVVKEYKKLFDAGVENSYRISDARYMLLRERFFKNFV